MLTLIGIYGALGLVAGIVAGLLGVGGGLIIVPTLVWLFRTNGIDESIVIHLAIGSSLATIVFTSIGSMRAHHKRGSLVWNMVALLTPGIVTGAFVGAWVADLVSTLWLQRFVAIIICLLGTQLLLNISVKAHRTLPTATATSLSGSVIGFISSMAGIGGGSLTVPYLVWHNVPMVKAVGTASACGLPIAIAGATGFLLSGWEITILPTYTTGYLYWPAIIGISLTSFAMAPVGAHLAHRLPVMTLRRVFAVLLILVGIRLF